MKSIMNEDRKVIPAKEVNPDLKTDTYQLTKDDLDKEYAYALATKMIKGMLVTGLITQYEYAKIDAKNRQSFSPYLSALMP